MDSSRRAVESYWRSRMIDAATSDDDKVTPVYKLEEICELLRSSHVSIVKEISEFVLKRLDHKSPVVKQKALRLIKYSVSKAGVEFRREMQRHSVAVRQLFHYKGHPDPLKGDAPNKAVRDMAHEAISALFAAEDDKPAPTEGLTRRIEGFGNTSYDKPSEDKKSFLSEVVGFGSASIKQGLSSLTQTHMSKQNDVGNYRSPNLRRSLTTENYRADRYEPSELSKDEHGSYRMSKNDINGPWREDANQPKTETTNGESSSQQTKTCEERLLETIVSTGGVRLQPTRDVIQVFLVEAAKLDMIALSRAIEGKLTSPSWQIRVKAICVLDSILRRKGDDQFAIVASYFEDNIDVVVQCSESPQASLREKAHKVLTLLNGDEITKTTTYAEKQLKVETTNSQLPDLIDTDDFNLLHEREEPSNENLRNDEKSSAPFIDDLFGGSLVNGVTGGNENTVDDPFADVSFHANEDKEKDDDLFQGMTFGETSGNGGANSHGSGVFDIFGSSLEAKKEELTQKRDVQHLMADLSFNEKEFDTKQPANTTAATTEDILLNLNDSKVNNQIPLAALNSLLGSQATSSNLNSSIPMAPMMYGMPPGVMFNQALPSQMMNYGAMGSLLAQQQQLLATMANFQQLGNMSSQNTVGGLSVAPMDGGYNSALPDIFHAKNQTPVTLMGNSKKEDTKAFDFISDHVAAARGPKRVL
uniref:VHS domain-containing protein n=1 Tax=Kalanchoe fedtschenkoi TaxID=63787 RepID=A0A7N1A5U6_KALFE